MQNNTVEEGKTAAIIAYLWWIGLIIAFVMNKSKQNSFTSFHIRQMIGLLLLSFVAGVVFKYAGSTIGSILNFGVFILWIIGLIGAIKGEEKEVPLLGDKFQELFKSIS